MQSQTLSRAKVTSSISPSGDTIISMRLDYAKILLNEVLDKQIADSLLVIYKQKDSLNNELQCRFELFDKYDNSLRQKYKTRDSIKHISDSLNIVIKKLIKRNTELINKRTTQ